MRKFLFATLVCVGCAAAHADSLNQSISNGFDLIEAGDSETALAAFRALQTDQPDSDLVQYSIGYAQYAQGLKQLNGDQAEAGLSTVQEAKTTFDKLIDSSDAFIRDNARYNAANCTALLAKNTAPQQEYKEALDTYRQSVDEYEQLLEDQPAHGVARENLDHMRYLLKTMLQNPPPEQEDQEKQEGDGDPEEQDQEGEQEQNDQESDDQSEDQNGDGQPQENEQEGPTKAPSEPQQLDRQNIEAILQSLEDQNREEQKKLRRAKSPAVVKAGKWW